MWPVSQEHCCWHPSGRTWISSSLSYPDTRILETYVTYSPQLAYDFFAAVFKLPVIFILTKYSSHCGNEAVSEFIFFLDS